jgi:hypothetical protein
VHNFYTISKTEIDTALQNEWCVAAADTFYIYLTLVYGNVPFYRLYNTTKMANLYTISESERLDFNANQGYIASFVQSVLLVFDVFHGILYCQQCYIVAVRFVVVFVLVI